VISREKSLLFLSLFFFSGATIAASTLLHWTLDDQLLEVILLIVLAVACILPAVVRLLQGRLDLFEPVYVFAFSKFVYFVLVPVVLLPKNDFFLAGINYRAEVKQVLALALLALLGFYLGYYWPLWQSRQRNAVASPSHSDPETRRSLARWAVLLSVFFYGLVVLWIVIAELPLESLWIFGQASYGDLSNLAAGPQIGYLYGARDALPVCSLLLIATRSKRRWPPAALVLLLLTFLFFAGIGGRYRVLLLLVSVFVYYYLERQKRPRTVVVLAMVLVVYFFVVGGIGFYRAAEPTVSGVRSRVLGEDVFTAPEAWDTFLSSSRLVTSTAALVHAIPKYIDHLWGQSFLGIFLQPIPRFLWPDKPSAIGLESLSEFWPTGTAAPFWALFYVNFGALGVLVGMALWGGLSRWIYEIYRRNTLDPLAQVQLALYYAYTFHVYGRGATTFAFIAYGIVYVLLPVWLLWWMRRKRTRGVAATSQARVTTPT
jgi:oligosaccharide repeat unit polymerase